MKVATVFSFVLFALGSACGSGSDGPCDPTKDACTLSTTLDPITAPAGYEDEDLCQSWTLDNPTELWVRSITQTNEGAYHHANWFFVPDDMFDLPDGAWSCREHSFRELDAAIVGGYLFAMSTQSLSETQEFPAGGATRIPPYSRIVAATHILNASDVPVESALSIEVNTVPPDEVAAKLVPARMTYSDLTIDPQARSSFTTECQLDEKHVEIVGGPLQYDLYYILSHYHSLGRYAQLEVAGGPRDGEVIFRADGFGENVGLALDPPFSLSEAGATGLRLTCGFDNPRDEQVGWGIGDQEMCVMALTGTIDMGWDGQGEESARIGVAPDGEINYQAGCSILALPWNHNKPGGPPRD